MCWPELAYRRRGLGTIVQKRVAPLCVPACVPACLHVCLNLLCCSLPKPLLPPNQKEPCRGRLTSQTCKSLPILQPRGKKKDLSKCNWEQTKETEFFMGFTTITTEACDSHSNFLLIDFAPNHHCLLRNTKVFCVHQTCSHLNADAQAHKHT